jgi:hypothetical protein
MSRTATPVVLVLWNKPRRTWIDLRRQEGEREVQVVAHPSPCGAYNGTYRTMAASPRTSTDLVEHPSCRLLQHNLQHGRGRRRSRDPRGGRGEPPPLPRRVGFAQRHSSSGGKGGTRGGQGRRSGEILGATWRHRTRVRGRESISFKIVKP